MGETSRGTGQGVGLGLRVAVGLGLGVRPVHVAPQSGHEKEVGEERLKQRRDGGLGL